MKLMELSEILEMMTIKKGDELQFNRGVTQVVYFLRSETVKVIAEDCLTRYMVKKGNIFGELPLTDDTPNND